MRFYPRFLIYFIWICSFRWELLCLALSPSSPLSPVQKHPFQTESGFRMLNLSQSQFTADSVFPVLVGHGLTIDSNFFSSGKKTIETSGEEVHLKNLHYSSLFPSAIGWIKTTWVPTERICSQCLKIQLQLHSQCYFWVVLPSQKHLFNMWTMIILLWLTPAFS